MASQPSPPTRIRSFKGGVNGRDRRKVTVTGYISGSQPSVEIRLFRDDRDPGSFIDLSVPQAREMLRLLGSAIEGACQTAPATTGRNTDVTGRAPAGQARSHGTEQ